MRAVVNIQSCYGCERCKSASDIYGRSCKHGLLFPVGLMLANMTSCPNYEFDAEKVEESLNNKDDYGTQDRRNI